jgi:valyl-tRNA synthetase
MAQGLKMSEKAVSYEPKNIEDNYYKIWESRGYFELEGNKNIQKKGKNFSVMMPPPNVTGSLHIGHALTFTLQDILTRYKRMDGYKTLWQPGVDHAGIATQNVVEKQLLKNGVKKEDIGREKFLQEIWKWKNYSGGEIIKQLRKLGASPAWSRERFTMDEGLKNAVRKAFVTLYDEGLIERGNYMVNWCTHDGALSDIEVEYEEHKGKLYYLKYFFKNSDKYLTVATTRPETFFGDTAVMVNPDDERYKQYIGKSVILPIINREIKVISDLHVDKEFGSGCVKVTPAHDINDYEVGKRHNLEFITIFDENGILNNYCGIFEGKERLKARNDIVDALQKAGNIEKIEDYVNQVGHCYRCKNIVEPYISKQWFVKKEIAKGAIEKVNNSLVKFHPPHWINSYNAWMKDLKDWCISRQLWWGHRIPVFYCDECGFEWASNEENPDKCPKCDSKNFHQDPDVLDTWFSSGLWPFSTLGWENGENIDKKYGENDLQDFYPNSILITGFDILFFWVARMMFSGEHFMKKLPFENIYLHALVRDEFGQKMSKSKGNVIDPLDMINEFSADVLRFTLAVLAVQGRDIKLSKDRLEQMRNFTNKLFNASRFLLLNEKSFQDLQHVDIKTKLGLYIKSRLNATTKEVRDYLESYRFNDAATTLYRFLWGEFCDWGIELAKAQKEAVNELGAIFKEAMKLLHPFMPFISEYLYQELSGTSLEEAQSIMIKPYPDDLAQDKEIEETFSLVIEAIVGIRRAKATLDIAGLIPKAAIKFENKTFDEQFAPFVKLLAKVENITFVKANIENAVRDVGDNLEVFIPLENVDLTLLVQRLNAQKIKLEKEIAKFENMLSNEKFIANAPKDVVEQNKNALNDAKSKISKVNDELNTLSKVAN